MDTGFLAAILVAAVLVYDRLGGNHEVSRRLFQVGLAVSLVFVAVSATAAFIRTDAVQGGFGIGSGSGSANDEVDRLVTASAVEYGFGVVLLIAGSAMLRRYHTIPLGLVLAGVFLLFSGPNLSRYSATFSLTQGGSSQKVDVAVFGAAVGGTLALLAYGMQLERDFALDSESEEDDADAESTIDSA